jgi:predicted RNase H-like nuclease
MFEQNAYTLGIDGCRGGWVVAVFSGYSMEFTIVECLHELDLTDVQRVFLDIPIGLPEAGQRICDLKLREALPKHLKSSVFPCPVREAVYAPNYIEARRISLLKTGKSMSIQAWNICPKIREADEWLAENKEFQQKVFESHPELNWLRLNVLNLPSKHTVEGINVRRAILEERNVVVPDRLRIKTVGAKRDDILDAAVLAMSARLSLECGISGVSGDPVDVWTFQGYS